jgi:hypothetical protein
LELFFYEPFYPGAKVLVAPRPSEAPAERLIFGKTITIVRRLGRNCRFFLIKRAAPGGAFAAPSGTPSDLTDRISSQAFEAWGLASALSPVASGRLSAP